MPSVYILRCADGSYYVGTCTNLRERIEKHQDGSASSHTRSRRPVSLAYSEAFTSAEAARARERQIKRWSRAKKEALIAGNLALLKQL